MGTNDGMLFTSQVRSNWVIHFFQNQDRATIRSLCCVFGHLSDSAPPNTNETKRSGVKNVTCSQCIFEKAFWENVLGGCPEPNHGSKRKSHRENGTIVSDWPVFTQRRSLALVLWLTNPDKLCFGPQAFGLVDSAHWKKQFCGVNKYLLWKVQFHACESALVLMCWFSRAGSR